MILFLSIVSAVVYGQDNYQLSTHVLNIAAGGNGEGVKVELFKLDPKSNNWTKVDEKTTDARGGITDFLANQRGGNKGVYKLVFHTKSYFEKNRTKTFYPFIEVAFEITDDAHYHVPITLSPYGFSTYRESIRR